MSSKGLSFLAGALVAVLLLYAAFSRRPAAPAPDGGSPQKRERVAGSGAPEEPRAATTAPRAGAEPEPDPVEKTAAAREDLGRVSGRVVDDGGSPVAGAFAYLVAADAPTLNAATAPAAVRTGDDGRFDIAVSADGVADLGVSGEGYAPVLLRDVGFDGDGSTDVGDVVLGSGASVSGRVIDASGRPLAGVRVAANPVSESGESVPWTSVSKGGVALPGRAAIALRPVETAARGDGGYEIRGLSAGSSYRVSALPERAASSPDSEKTVVAPAAHVDLVVALSGVVVVRVVDSRSEEPIGGARVQIEGANGASAEWRYPDWRKDPVRFEHGLPPGEYAATASARGYESASERFEIADVATPVEVVVRLAAEDPSGFGAIRVTARDAAGAPIPQLCVAIRSGAFLAEANPGRGRPAETGVREIAKVPPGRYELLVTSQSREFGRIATEIEISAGETAELDLVLSRAARLAVDVRDESGADVAGYTIDVRDHEGRRIAAEISVRSGIASVSGIEPGHAVPYPGRLSIARLPEGEVALVFAGDGFEPRTETAAAKAGEEKAVTVALRRVR